MDTNDMAETVSAISQSGSTAFSTNSGAMLEHLSKLAHAGKLEEMSMALGAHLLAHPEAKTFVLGKIPAIILNQYLYLHRERPAGTLLPWQQDTPDWADRIKQVAADPERLTTVVAAMEADIRRKEIGR